MGMKWMKALSRVEYYKYPKYCGLQERRQLVCFLFASFVELIYIPANLMGMNSYHHALFFDVYNWVHLFFVIALQVLFWWNRISSRLALATCLMVGPMDYMLQSMRIFFVGYMLIFFALLYNTKAFGRGLRQPHVVDMEERKALQTLINLHEDEREQALSVMDQLSEDQKEKIRQNVQDYFHEQQIDNLAYAELCPELTKSEIEICKQILQGKSLKEMCDVLYKTESNITSQRAHICKKLGMNRKEELKSTLEFRIHEIRQRIKSEEKAQK